MKFDPIRRHISCFNEFNDFIVILNHYAPLRIYYSSSTIGFCFLSFCCLFTFSSPSLLSRCLDYCSSFTLRPYDDVESICEVHFYLSACMFGADYEVNENG